MTGERFKGRNRKKRGLAERVRFLFWRSAKHYEDFVIDALPSKFVRLNSKDFTSKDPQLQNPTSCADVGVTQNSASCPRKTVLCDSQICLLLHHHHPHSVLQALIVPELRLAQTKRYWGRRRQRAGRATEKRRALSSQAFPGPLCYERHHRPQTRRIGAASYRKPGGPTHAPFLPTRVAKSSVRFCTR